MKRGELGSLFCRAIGPHVEGNGSHKFYEEGSESTFRRISRERIWTRSEQKRSIRDITLIVQIKLTHG